MADTYRVLWSDVDGKGRFTDIEAHGQAEAAWKVAMDEAGIERGFIGVIKPPKPPRPVTRQPGKAGRDG